MPITSIFAQPAFADIVSAHRPIVYIIQASDPVCYCDIYFNNVYYRTISSTTFYVDPDGNYFAGLYYFDVHEAVQEYLRSTLPLELSAAIQTDQRATTAVLCRFRTGTVSGSGVITQDTPIPIQATLTSSAVTGAGAASYTCFATNAALQLEEGYSLGTYLQRLRASPFASPYLIYPMTRRRTVTLFREESAVYPFLVASLGSIFIGTQSMRIQITGSNGTSFILTPYYTITLGLLHYLPIGVPNLTAIAGATGIPFAAFEWYTISLVPGIGTPLPAAFTTQRIYLKRRCSDATTIFFLNNLGAFDAVSFQDRLETVSVKSGSFQRYHPGPTMDSLVRGRRAIESEDKLTVVSDAFGEQDRQYVREILEAPIAYRLRRYPDIVSSDNIDQPQAIRILDGDLEKRKIEERYYYTTEISFVPSSQRITIR